MQSKSIGIVIGNAYEELDTDDDLVDDSKPAAKPSTTTTLHGTNSDSITSPHNFTIQPVQLNFSVNKPIVPKKRCLPCYSMGYKSCQCHLVSQNIPLPSVDLANKMYLSSITGQNNKSSNSPSIFLPDNKTQPNKPKRKYTRTKDITSLKQPTQQKRKYTKRSKNNSNKKAIPPKKIKKLLLQI